MKNQLLLIILFVSICSIYCNVYDNSLHVSVSSISLKGKRRYLEDEYIVSNCGHFIAVLDGHGGASVSKFVRKNLYSRFLNNLSQDRIWSNDDITKALINSVDKVDKDVCTIKTWNRQGSTADIVFCNVQNVHNRDNTIITCNVGDSRAVLCRGGKAIDLTIDHKPTKITERLRIEKLGGYIEWHGLEKQGKPVRGQGVYRVNGKLSLSRAIGDFAEKPFICSIPDIRVTKMNEEDRFLICATDGLWDVFTSQEAVDYVQNILINISENNNDIEDDEDDEKRSIIGSNNKLSIDAQIAAVKRNMAKMLANEALKRDASDNITIIIQWLN